MSGEANLFHRNSTLYGHNSYKIPKHGLMLIVSLLCHYRRLFLLCFAYYLASVQTVNRNNPRRRLWFKTFSVGMTVSFWIDVNHEHLDSPIGNRHQLILLRRRLQHISFDCA